jgi:hypothetical protein
MQVRINVTPRDIERGRPGIRSCPIARAIKRTRWGRSKLAVTVGRSTVRVVSLGAWGGSAYILPEDARSFVSKFDRARPVEPFSFTLEVSRYAALTPEPTDD